MTKQIKMDDVMKKVDAQIGGAVKGSGSEGAEPKCCEGCRNSGWTDNIVGRACEVLDCPCHTPPVEPSEFDLRVESNKIHGEMNIKVPDELKPTTEPKCCEKCWKRIGTTPEYPIWGCANAGCECHKQLCHTPPVEGGACPLPLHVEA